MMSLITSSSDTANKSSLFSVRDDGTFVFLTDVYQKKAYVIGYMSGQGIMLAPN